MSSVSRSLLATPADDILVFGGSASTRLTAGICAELGIPARRGDVLRFSEGNL